MDEKIKYIVLGALLHDIGKIVQRSEKGKMNKKHSLCGVNYLKENGIEFDEEIIEQIQYHHYDEIKNSNIPQNSLAYITYCADNIASQSDRRERERDEDKKYWWFWRFAPLYTIFNVMNGRNERWKYTGQSLYEDGDIPYPLRKPKAYDYGYYKGIIDATKDSLDKVSKNWSYFNIFLSTMEKNWSFVPDCTCMQQLVDISLYDHSKMTAAFASCMYQYAIENGREDYKETFFKKATQFYKEKAFCILTLDISGIQKFIYTIHSDGALKNLRARSFYIEILMEYITDELLKMVSLTRTNALYIGGGSANILLPNTNEAKKKASDYIKTVNQWFMKEFQTVLHLGYSMQECSVNDLNTRDVKGKTPYGFINKSIRKELDIQKMHCYDADGIRSLNPKNYSDLGIDYSKMEGRECRICHRVDNLITKKDVFKNFKYQDNESDNEYYCSVCMSMLLNSSYILNHEKHEIEGKVLGTNKDIFYVINDENYDKNWLIPLPSGRKLLFDTEIRDGINYEYIYNKNGIVDAVDSGNHIWVADYKRWDTLEELAKSATGIERIGVIRADVDELGKAFAEGFQGDYNTISRKANFSRMLSLFFKYHIQHILEHGETYIGEQPASVSRNATVVYSGGDDLFIIGSWDDIIGFAIDLKNKFSKFTRNQLTLSAGVGIYPAKYPISTIAREVGELEQCAKLNDGKNSITLFHEEFTFHWDCFIDKVVGEKLRLIQNFFDQCSEYGNAFLYHLLELFKSVEEQPISLARYAFFIAKMEPTVEQKKKNPGLEEAYNNFRSKVYDWMKNAANEKVNNDKNDLKQCILAVYLYIYLHRKKEDEKNDLQE